MPPRTLASLAHALSASSSLDAALVALGEALEDIDRSARIALLRYQPRKKMLKDALVPNALGGVDKLAIGTAFEHLPPKFRSEIVHGGRFADFGEDSEQYARLLGLTDTADGSMLALRGLTADGTLAAVLALYEPRRIFGTRVMERFAPAAALFDLAFSRFAEQEARQEAVRTLENVTERVHADYLEKLHTLETQMLKLEQQRQAMLTPTGQPVMPEQLLALEQEAAKRREQARRATHRAKMLEQQAAAAVEQLERAHIELHRRSETARQKIRSLYLLERVLALDASTEDPRKLADGMVALLGDDMQAQRCSIVLRAPEPRTLYLAAARGLPPDVPRAQRIRLGEGVAGKVAERREPVLVRDVADTAQHPYLKDDHFTTGSFISFPLVYHDTLIGVVNVTNRAQRGVYVEEDVDRVRTLALLIALIAENAELPERLFAALHAA
jgi:putative methionine-R-sulfoxide reductase with GAF domain